MTQTEVWTIGRLLTWTADYLQKQGSESPRLDAEVLLAFARGTRRIELYTAFAEPADDQLRTRFRELVRRRAEGTPVAYLVGRKEFFSLSFRITADVLVPRPETEFVLITLLDLWKAHPQKETAHVVDVGTGSGILAVCAARQTTAARVTAIDLSPAALELARSNAQEHSVAERMDFLAGDLLTPLPAERSIDFIVSNPPYISRAELEKLPRDVRDHEPHLALLAGERGTEVIERLIPQAAERLAPGGWLILEISPMIHRAVVEQFAASGDFQPAQTAKDLAQLPRVVFAQRK